MKHSFLVVLLLFGVVAATSQDRYRLAPPIIRYPSVFFTDTISVAMAFAQPGAQIRYTLDGKLPRANSALYKRPLKFTKNRVVLKTRSFAPGYQPSEVVTTQFVQAGKQIERMEISPPNEKYAAAGWKTLTDNVGGDAMHSSGKWLGFDSEKVQVTVELAKPEKISSLLFSVLENQGSWIFLPDSISVSYANTQRGQWYTLPTRKLPEAATKRNGGLQFIEYQLPAYTQATRINIVFYTKRHLPNWHEGAGKQGWLFLDEIKVF